MGCSATRSDRRRPTHAAAPSAPPARCARDARRRERRALELRRRRDALAEQVTELHWDLGGLAYEMAIRDHFRLDVLVRRAAVLQERDAELAEVERLLRMEDEGVAGQLPELRRAPQPRRALLLAVRHDADGARCRAAPRRRARRRDRGDGRAARAAGGTGASRPQRGRLGAPAVSASARSVCEECGSRAGARPALLPGCGARVGRAQPAARALAATRRGDRAPGGRPRAAEPRPPRPLRRAAAPAPARAACRLRLPSPRVSALLVLVFLGFGVLIGNAAGSQGRATRSASARSPLKVVLPPRRRRERRRRREPAAESAGGGRTDAVGSRIAKPNRRRRRRRARRRGERQTHSKAGSGRRRAAARRSTGSQERLRLERQAREEAAADQARVRDHALRRALRVGVRARHRPRPTCRATLEHKGELLVRYDAVAHEELANEIALLSGQGPTPETAANCPTYTEIAPTGSGPDEQVLGSGCVYPRSTQTLAGQLSAKHLTWRAYVQGIDEAGHDSAGACAHPALGAARSDAPNRAASTRPLRDVPQPVRVLRSRSSTRRPVRGRRRRPRAR